MKQPRGRGLAAIGAPQGRRKQRNLQPPNLDVEIGSLRGHQNRFLGCDAFGRHAERQVAGTDIVSANCHHQPLDQILQLAHISRPGMFFKGSKRIGCHLLDRYSVSQAMNFEEVVAEQGKIALSLPERRQLNRDHMNPVEEILAKLPRPDHLFERLVGGANQSEIDLAHGAPAEPLHLMVFKHTKQLGLQWGRQSGNLIEKQRAAIGQLNLPRPRFGGSRKRSALAAEKLRFDQASQAERRS